MTSTQARARPGPFGIGPSSSNNVSNKGFGSGFSSGSGAWNEGIWSDKVIGSGMKSGIQDTGRAQNGLQVSGSSGAITGSGSLLSSSESEGFNLRQGSWKSVEDPSPGLSRVHTNGSSTSSMHHQNSNQLNTHSFNDTNSANSTYFSLTPTSTNISSRPSQKNFLDPTSGSFVAATSDPSSLSRASRHNSDEETRFAARKMAFEGTDTGLIMQSTRPSFNNNVTGYNGSTAASRSGSMPPSRGDVDPSMRYPNDISQYSRYNESAVHGQNHLSAQAPSYTMPAKSTGQKHPDHFSPSQLSQLLGEFGNLSVGKDIPQNCYPTESEASYAMSSGHGNGYTQNLLLEGNDIWRKDDNGYPTQQDQFSPTGSGSGSLSSHQGARRGANFGAQYSQSSSVSDARLGHNLYYSTTGTPPTYQPRVPSRGGFSNGTLVTGQAALLERRLRGLQQEQQTYIVPRGTQMHYSNQISHLPAYDFHPQPGFRMNHINPYYPMPPIPHQMAAQNIPRGPAREHDVVQPVRSTLLEEFRNNSKTNKRYELKDIYSYIVEFSGDQHGSRFIQQKLETANSDEKDQVFRELFPNALQLMTDVFGNYVIQKFFEHGNQSQKKTLANQMRTHILTLSTQMYGCRVVQKALEHILTDQQAQLVRELENNVLKCVKDQNGNHVVQKAIERVPAEHIQFILNAFTGQVQGLATHPYGCRVIQRMLEHCEEPTQTAVLHEIHDSASSLILDQFGNYVAQHIIEHGRDEDRRKLVGLVISQLSTFSKHKFASNVVEKSIQFGLKEERDQIVATLTAVNDKGESPSQSLIRDQFGNYVIQKLLNILKGSERDDFIELIKAQLTLLKRFSYGKQIASIEKIIYTTPYPPHPFTPNSLPPPVIDASAAPSPLVTDVSKYSQTSSLPSTHASFIIGPDGSRKSSGSNEVGIMTPTST